MYDHLISFCTHTVTHNYCDSLTFVPYDLNCFGLSTHQLQLTSGNIHDNVLMCNTNI